MGNSYPGSGVVKPPSAELGVHLYDDFFKTGFNMMHQLYHRLHTHAPRHSAVLTHRGKTRRTGWRRSHHYCGAHIQGQRVVHRAYGVHHNLVCEYRVGYEIATFMRSYSLGCTRYTAVAAAAVRSRVRTRIYNRSSGMSSENKDDNSKRGAIRRQRLRRDDGGCAPAGGPGWHPSPRRRPFFGPRPRRRASRTPRATSQ